MRDPLYIILSFLNSLIVTLTKIIDFVFTDFFPSPTPEEPDNSGFRPLGK